MSNNGIKKMICLVSDSVIPLFGLPVELKKFDIMGCTKFMNMQKKYILKYLTANS